MQKPPFRADHVGSLLRPIPLREARAARAAGTLSAEALRAAEDAAIRTVIAEQKAIGLKAVTDGEFRRAFWHFDFLAGLGGVEMYEADQGIQFQGGQTKAYGLKVTGPIRYEGHPFVRDYAFVAANAGGAAPKITIPSPSVLHFRGGRRAVDAHTYPDMAGFFTDLGEAYAAAVADFAGAGCRYLQLDEVNIAYLCDPDQIAGLKARGEETEGLLGKYADLINRAIAGRPSDMFVSMHLCRGNFRSMHIAQGGYDPVAEVLFNGINVNAYFMEYDDERSGSFAPLRFLPKGKTVVLGLVTSKRGELESKDLLKRRIEAAAKYAPLEQLAISPQCGFASTEEGNVLTVEEQWAKLRLCVEVAQEVWGAV
ncbi:5-methyltetrahydropteroyltriglutamate--homocysteine S-methyltransferase [Roseococcus sp. SDR]|uniref:5-methyltetrahydropteroyltriglutamate-- homocysteine S-methyltransferase n=1 Tax=Roseococcus sp. SDR TaxID=2835532 RepID=UPI001BCEC031|nr:5-methyltetrahydropteroyltriglutamate--homocysteine S-methyltransferase [Roseococcus sp. SDR]MBS7791956.1 5-methyltetrahydropteroyltriglutamate--homocysteine S-methyltransferase [Roseococcus sp. SDR]MBV1847270.1 5-methyltetrahydropteroyltriglutamate--homocysteine S-methyltransferase [Roseococcus sp. SDR]